jgi:DNA-directed RNA polymerase subunit A'
LITPRYGLPIIGLINDHILASYLLTQDDTNVSRGDVMELLMQAGIIKDLGPKKEFTGKEVFSMLLPEDFDFDYHANDNNHVVIKKGKLISGVIDKSCMALVRVTCFIN